MQPGPKLASLPGGQVTGLEAGCTGVFQVTVADSAHAFAEDTSLIETCADGSTLECDGDDSLASLSCRWQANQNQLDFCDGCWFDATLVQLD